MLEQQRALYLARHQADQALRLLSASQNDPCFGYQVNNYRHCLQSATMVLRDGLPEEDVVVALLHDVGFIACPLLHGDFAASLLGAYVSDRNHWMLRHHATFQNLHSPNMPATTKPPLTRLTPASRLRPLCLWSRQFFHVRRWIAGRSNRRSHERMDKNDSP
jgi:hypothetical protein